MILRASSGHWRCPISVLAYADDLALLANSPEDLQKLIQICRTWSQNNGLEFSPSKSKVLVFHPKKQTKKHKKFKFNLNGKILERVNSFKYLGIDIDAAGDVAGPGRCYRTFFTNSLNKAETRLASIRLLGYHKDGLRVESAIRLYKLLVRPVLEFGAQVVPLSETQLVQLEQFQVKSLCTLLGLLSSTKAETA